MPGPCGDSFLRALLLALLLPPLRRLRAIMAVLGALSALQPAPVFAHPWDPPAPETLWQAWNWDGVILLALIGWTVLYLRGWAAQRHRVASSPGRSRQLAAFLLGMLLLAAILLSPLHRLAYALFSAHMVQHLLLILVAAPLIVWSLPVGTVAVAFAEPRLREPVRRLIRPTTWALQSQRRYPLAVLLLHFSIVWVWHIPRAYQAAMESEVIHGLEHATLFVSAMLYWFLVWRAAFALRRSGLLAVAILLVTGLQGGLLGALLTLTPQPWYAAYGSSTGAWGLTSQEDQVLGGVLMWVPGGMFYILAGVTIFLRWLTALDSR